MCSRLWGDHGQSALERANICLVNATATGTEILKSLVLPGIGAFTIIDPAKVTGEDVGNNFFLTADSVGGSRGEVAARLLAEMNHEVRGETRQESVETILDSDPGYLNTFTLVIATGCSDKVTHLSPSVIMTFQHSNLDPVVALLQASSIQDPIIGGADLRILWLHPAAVQ